MTAGRREQIGAWIARVLERPDHPETAEKTAAQVLELSREFPLFTWEPALR